MKSAPGRNLTGCFRLSIGKSKRNLNPGAGLDRVGLHIYDLRAEPRPGNTIYARIGTRWLLGVGAADFSLKTGQRAHGIFSRILL